MGDAAKAVHHTRFQAINGREGDAGKMGALAGQDAGKAHHFTAGVAVAETDQALGFVVREALTNVIRHSEATQCRLQLDQQANRVVLRVEDDGIGKLDRSGFGVRSIHERIEAMGRQVEFTCGRGLKLKVSLPCAESSVMETDLVPAAAQ